MERGAWRVRVHRVTKSQTRLSNNTHSGIPMTAEAQQEYYFSLVWRLRSLRSRCYRFCVWWEHAPWFMDDHLSCCILQWQKGPGSLFHKGTNIIHGGRSPGRGHGNSLQYSCLENPMDRGAWWAIVYRVAKSPTWLKGLITGQSHVWGCSFHNLTTSQRSHLQGLSWWSSSWESAFQCRRRGFDPWPGTIPHAVGYEGETCRRAWALQQEEPQ